MIPRFLGRLRPLDYGLFLATSVLVLAAGWAIVRFSPAWDWRIWTAILAIALSVVLSFATTRRVLFVSPQIALVVMYVLLIHIGSIGFYHSDPADNAQFIVLSSLALLAFSVPLAFAWLHGNLPEPEGGVVNDLVGDNEVIWNIFAAVGVVGALYYMLRGASAAGGLPLLHLLHGFASVRSLADSRLGFSDGTAGYMYELYGVMLPVSAVAFMLRWLATGSRRHRRRALLLLAFSAFTLVAAGYRGPVELFFLLVAIALSYGGGGLRNKTGAAVAVLAGGIFILLSAGIYSNNPGTNTGQATQARVFQVQAIGPAFVAQAYPSVRPYTNGASLMHDLEGALPGRQAGFSSELPALRDVRSHNNPVGAPFDAYVNFGPAGLAAMMFILGCATMAVHLRLARKRTVSAIALGSGLSGALAAASIAGIAGVLLQYGVVTVALMAGVRGLLISREWRMAARRAGQSSPSAPVTHRYINRIPAVTAQEAHEHSVHKNVSTMAGFRRGRRRWR